MKTFSLDGSLYDLDTFSGRLTNFYNVINPLRLFTSSETFEADKQLIAEFKAGALSAKILESPEQMNRKLWAAKGNLNALMHPNTEERLPLYFSPCAFIPANIPICVGMLLSPPTQFNAALWQWVNQSYNAGFNYSNRPISVKGDEEVDESAAMRTMMIAYGSATGVSCSLALGLNAWLKKATLSPAAARALGVAIPYSAVAGAGMFNVIAMRYQEAFTGVPVTHPESGEELGTSVNVAYTGLGQCAISRMLLPAPILLIPPYLMPVVQRAFPKMAEKAAGKLVLNLTVLIIAVTLGFPPAIALFPQKGTYPTASLEPELKSKCESVCALSLQQ